MRIPEYDEGYDSKESFERAGSDTEESLREDDEHGTFEVTLGYDQGPDRKIVDKAFHRNGSGGLPFHVYIVHDSEEGDMLVVRFQKDCDQQVGAILCAAFSIEKLARRDIAFNSNSFRGDVFADLVDKE